MRNNDAFDTRWRRTAAAVFDAPTQPNIQAAVDLDVTIVERLMNEQPRRSVRLIHYVVAAAARTIAEDVPEVNCYVRRGSAIPKDSIDITVSAMLPGTVDLIDLTLRQAAEKSVDEIAAEMRSLLASQRRSGAGTSADRRYALSKIPWPFRRWTFRALRFITSGLGMPLPRYDLAPESFGAVMITDMSRFDLPVLGSYAPIFPAASVSTFFLLCAPQDRVVSDGGLITTRRKAPLSATVDHRLIDGYVLARLFDGIIRRLQDPETLLVPRTQAEA